MKDIIGVKAAAEKKVVLENDMQRKWKRASFDLQWYWMVGQHA